MYTQATDPRVVSAGYTDIEGAKLIARRIFETYDRDRNGVIDQVETVPMIVDAYKSFNRLFSPSRGVRGWRTMRRTSTATTRSWTGTATAR